MQGAAKVGALVVLFIVLFYGAYAILGRGLFGTKTEQFYAEFNDSTGLAEGAKVLLSGVEVGAVEKIQLTQPKLVRITLGIHKGTEIPVGSTAVISGSLTGLGETPLQIVPPAAVRGGYLEPGSVIPGGRTSPLQALFPDSDKALHELTATLEATRKLLQDEGFMDQIKTLIKTTDETAKKFGNIATQTEGMIAENRGSLRDALQSTALTMRQIQDGTELAVKMLKDGKFQKESLALLENLNATSRQADKLLSSMNGFINDPQMRQSLDQTAQNTAKITDSGTRIAQNAEEISANGKVISAKAIEFADKANKMADEATTLIQKFQQIIGGKPSAGSLGNLKSELSIARETDPNYWRTDANFTLGLPDSTLHLGIYDAFESNKINIQLGKPIGKNGEFRYGIYASKPGVGVDYPLARQLSFRGDLFDINSPRLDLSARYEFGKGIIGWIGLGRVFEDNTPTIGLGIRR